MSLPDIFLTAPIAHRGLHNRKDGIIENSVSAFQRAVDCGYGIELDVQLSRDAQAMVFHDYDLKRLTGSGGAIQQQDAKDLGKLRLAGGTDVIHNLSNMLALVQGRVPVLIEIKDQDGQMGPEIGPLERAVAVTLAEYNGPVAVMSFNPHSVLQMADLCPDIPRGLVTSAFNEEWPLPRDTRDRLRKIADYARAGSSFISHDAADLSASRVADLKHAGASILCWTIKSQVQADAALHIADNITFEGFTPS